MAEAELFAFGVRCIFHWTWPDVPCFEERITMWVAPDAESAVVKAEAEALEYETEGILYLGFAQTFRTFIQLPIGLQEGDEVFSLLRESNLDPDDYLDRFFDTGQERQSTIPSE